MVLINTIFHFEVTKMDISPSADMKKKKRSHMINGRKGKYEVLYGLT